MAGTDSIDQASLRRIAGIRGEVVPLEDRRWFVSVQARIREVLTGALGEGHAGELVPVCIGACEIWSLLLEPERELSEAYAAFAQGPNERAILLFHATLAALRTGDPRVGGLLEQLESLRDQVEADVLARLVGVALFAASQAEDDEEVEQLALRCSMHSSFFLRDAVSMHALNRGQTRRALALIELWIQLSEQDGADVWMARALLRLSQVQSLPTADSVEALEQARALADRGDLPKLLFWVRLDQARLCLLSDDLETARQHAQWVVREQPQFMPMPTIAAMCQIRIGDVHLAAGDLARALQAYDSGFEHAQRVDSTRLLSRLRLRRAVAAKLAAPANAEATWPEPSELLGLRHEEIFAWEQLVRTEMEALQTSVATQQNLDWDVRIALHILGLRRKNRAGAGPTTTWKLAPDFTTVVLETGVKVRLRKGSPKCGILKLLVESAQRDREARVATTKLIEAAWPGQDFIGDSGRSRVWTTLHRMRLDGLEQIESSAKGYRIAPNVALKFT